jgi:hypothetical protein
MKKQSATHKVSSVVRKRTQKVSSVAPATKRKSKRKIPTLKSKSVKNTINRDTIHADDMEIDIESDTKNNDSISQTKIDASMTKIKKMYASNTIGKFMKNTEQKRKALFLKVVCSDSGACLAVGSEIKRINQFFNHYTDFTYAVEPIRKIGIPSDNGFIKEITYNRDGYMSYAILKSSISQHSDNLMYEYEVGREYINKQNKIFSCFLETYGLYVYNSDSMWNYFKDSLEIDRNAFINGITAIPHIDYRKGCVDAKYIAILIQHINNALSFSQFIRNALAFTVPDFARKQYALSFEVFYILYQVYFVLDILKNEFTHYDLHTGNVLLYEPTKDGYITYHYHLNSGKTIQFHSKYIAKIIDYGRCYYHADAEKNSKNTYDRICAIRECDPECGENVGFKLLAPDTGKSYYKSSQTRNMSHDLRLAYIVASNLLKINDNSVIPPNKSLLQRIVYEKRYGTPERENGPIDAKYNIPAKINNVSDMRAILEYYISIEKIIKYNEYYHSPFTKMGDMHIYEDRRPMEYVKFV